MRSEAKRPGPFSAVLAASWWLLGGLLVASWWFVGGFLVVCWWFFGGFSGRFHSNR